MQVRRLPLLAGAPQSQASTRTGRLRSPVRRAFTILPQATSWPQGCQNLLWCSGALARCVPPRTQPRQPWWRELRSLSSESVSPRARRWAEGDLVDAAEPRWRVAADVRRGCALSGGAPELRVASATVPRVAASPPAAACAPRAHPARRTRSPPLRR